MQPRSRIRGRDALPSGGRYRRRSPPPPSPRHQRRPRDRPPPLSQRRSPEQPPPRRHEENPLPDPPAAAAGERRLRADILLEAGRLAAHYLVAKGVLPERVLRAREDPNLNLGFRPEPPAPASYGRKRDDDDSPRGRQSGGGAGDWGRGKVDDDRQARRSGWDNRRSHSFDGRRKYNDRSSGDVDRGGRRARDYDEPKRPPMSRSYSHNDRRPSADGRMIRRRSRSRSRTRTKNDYSGSKRDSDWRAGSRDLDHTKVPDSGIIHAAAGDGDVHYADVDEMPRRPKVPCSVVVAEVNDSASRAMAIKDGQMESEILGLDHAQYISEDEDGEFAEGISEDEDGEFAVAGLNDKDGGEMDVSQHQLSSVDVHPLESVEEPMHMQSQFSNVEEKNETGIAHMDASMVEQLAENNGCSEVRYELEAAHGEVEIGVGDLSRDEQELPAWYKIFDLNVVETPEGCAMSDISGGPPADHVSDSLPDLVGRMKANYNTSQIQCQDEHAGSNHMLEDEHDLSNYDLNNEADEHAQDDSSEIQGEDEHAGDNDLVEDGHDLIKYDLNNEADEHALDNHLLNNEELLLNHGMAVHHSGNCHLSNEKMLLKQNADGQEHDNHQMENEQMLINQGITVQGSDSLHVNNGRLLLSHGADEHRDEYHQMEPEPAPFPLGMQDLDSYDLNSEQLLLNTGADQHAADIRQLKDGQMLLDQVAIGEASVHNMDNERMIPVIDLEDDYEQQSYTRGTGSDTSHKYTDNVLQDHTCSQDQKTSSFPGNPQTNIQAASSSSVIPNFGIEIGVREGVL